MKANDFRIMPICKELFALVQTAPTDPVARAAYKAKRAAEALAEFQRRQPLVCDKCGNLMGAVTECDLNGSTFYCLLCHEA